ncbi:MAG: hypothetical protein IT261_13210 [Saprospiraceae bacterium]|nr:hypothetical protein [Saprospiraceae bacterium]
MTTKRISIAFVLLTLFLWPVFAQTTATKTFTRAFNTDGKDLLRLELPGEVDLKVWDNPSVRLEISVSLPIGNGPMLNELASIGRYNLNSKTDANVLVIDAPNMQKQLKVKGQDLKENVTFVVYVPKKMEVQITPPVAVLADAKK